ncbi:MAG: VWA domain-containing protein [Firmicutes bacterium]|nr:VWA domain-containing protein [Bacillota bacterium]
MNFLNQMKKGETYSFKEEQTYKTIRNVNEPHLAFLLLLDTSTSMGSKVGMKTKIQLLNEAIARLKAQMMMDEFAASRVDIAVVEFNSGARVVCDWVPLSEFKAPVLEAEGMTSMGEGGNLAIDMVKERRRFYKEMGTPSYAGHIFMITDGEPNDDTTRLKQRIAEEDAKDPSKCKMKWFSCAVPGADENFLAGLSKRKVALDSHDFGKMFNWIGQSLVIVSNSKVGENPQLPALPEGMRVVPSDW